MAVTRLEVHTSQPKVIPLDQKPGPEVQGAAGATAPAPVPALVHFWTEEKAQKAYAYACRALAERYGDDMKASDFELDMIGLPLAAVLEDWWPVKPGESGSKEVNLLILAGVLAIFMLTRVPRIWAFERDRRQQPKGLREREQARRPAEASPVVIVGADGQPLEPSGSREQTPAAEGNSERPSESWKLYGIEPGQPTLVGSGRLHRE